MHIEPHRVFRFDGHKAERKNIAIAAGVALQDGVPQRTVFVQRHLLVPRLDLHGTVGNLRRSISCYNTMDTRT